MTFRPLGAKTVASGKIVSFEDVRLQTPDGRVVARDVIRHPGGVAVLPIDGDQVWFVDQYRVALDRRILEIPAGKMDQPGESIEALAARELEEETGFRPATLIPLGHMLPSPGYTDEVIHLFAADGIVATSARPLGAEEDDANLVRLGLEDALDRAVDGRLEDAKTRIALLAWMRRAS